MSEYNVYKIEIAGSLLDINGKTIYEFDTWMKFGTGTISKNPSPVIMIDKDLIYNVCNVSFTKIRAYTIEDINTGS